MADDLEAQRRFYCDVLGLRETEAGTDWVQGDPDGHPFEVIRRGRCSRPPHRASTRCGLVRRWARVPSCRQRSDLGGIIGNAVLNTSQLDPTWPCPLQLHHCSTLGARRCAPSAACPNRSRDERRNPARGQGRVIHHQRPGKQFDIAAFRVMRFRGRTPQVNHLGHLSAHRTGSNERSRTRHARSCAARVQKVPRT